MKASALHDPEAAYVFHERLGVADGLHMPTSQHSEAWRIAAREAARTNQPRAQTVSQAHAGSSPKQTLDSDGW
jgi:hypothetical protein